MPTKDERLAYSVAEVAEIAGESYQSVIKAIHAGNLKAKRNGPHRYKVLRPAVEEWLDAMPDA